MKILYLIVLIPFAFMGCSTSFYSDLATGEYKLRPGSETSDRIFADCVKDDIKSELKSKQFPDGINWHDHWVQWCESLYYGPHLGDPYIQYIVTKRREAGLPEIPEIVNRQFRSEWQIFTNNVDEKTDRETKGFPPPYSNYSQIHNASPWLEYWKIIKKQALNNSAISTKGIEYINDRRVQVGLKPLKSDAK